ncbi:hypothetical protein M0813_07488 [Anaeramoeba flamelloides]|uniref:Uncharacterized protein n=1 Tax=Anaeramoeba flamelloides TaxID=1746091 RepID=A0ABQ8XB57_9EUKA|nr:hypothetical protein M0813_07488 [Anaeramoeba flamelloides]
MILKIGKKLRSFHVSELLFLKNNFCFYFLLLLISYTYEISLGEALDNTNCTWTTGGDADWFGQTSTKCYGESAVQSGQITHSQETWLKTHIFGFNKLSFEWMVSTSSSSYDGDFVKFYMNETLKSKQKHDFENWYSMSYTIFDEGNHTLKWAYEKDSSYTYAKDCAWVDKFQVTPVYLVSLEEALDTTDFTWTTGGDADWFGQTAEERVGGSSARSGYIEGDQETWLSTNVEGPQKVSFYWQTSSRDDDLLKFLVNGTLIREIEGYDSYWSKYTHPIFVGGNHTLRWKYQKFWGSHSGEDCGWVDYFQVTPITIGPLGEALDNTALPWTTGGDADWFGQDVDYHFGGSSARSGSIGDDQETWLSTNVEGTQRVSFYWIVSSETDRDVLEFLVDGTSISTISGSQYSWEQITFDIIEEGNHTLRWKYQKNWGSSSGDDCGWVDKIEITPLTMVPLGEALDNTALTWTTGGDTDWFGQNEISYFGGSSAKNGPMDEKEEAWVSTDVYGPKTISFYWMKTNDYDNDYYFYVDGQRTAKACYDEWEYISYDLLDSGKHTIKWLYEKNSGTFTGDDYALLDKFETTPLTIVPLGEALDNTALTWTTGGAVEWYGQNVHYHTGKSAARSGTLTTNSDSWLKTVVNGPNTLTFKYKLDRANAGIALVMFFDDEGDGTTLSSTEEWQSVNVSIMKSGPVEVKWSFYNEHEREDDTIFALLDDVKLSSTTDPAYKVSYLKILFAIIALCHFVIAYF